ncbi:MAG: methyltransferase regulatory domain-containing protein, partial [Alphaproteobacteria bacterium]|nr:methyltransferase regulatory domain-containing protein [Alphaproteobacteria bacterium]
LHYLCCDESVQPLSDTERQALFGLTTKALMPSGLLGYGYQVAPTLKDVMKFLVREFAPEMNAAQALEMLVELRKLGTTLFKTDTALAAKLDEAIAKKMPDAFFALFDTGAATSKTLDTMVALRPLALAYAGDSHIPSNYVELSVPAEAQEVVVKCRDNQLYECIKDLAIGRHVRTDIWCKQPAVFSQSPAELFGGFAYGILPHMDVPTTFEANGKKIDFTTPLYTKLINLMKTTPMGIGDFLAHADGAGVEPTQIVEALSVLVACGIVHPMRGVHEALRVSSVAQPRLLGKFNQHLSQVRVDGDRQVLASAVLGDVISISPRDALVMQALDRAGLANSISALLPELQRLAANPAEAAQVTDLVTPSEESARRMIETVVTESIATWYAFGLLEAA